MVATPREITLRSWPGGRSIFWGACGGKTCRAEPACRAGCHPVRSCISLRGIATFARRAKCCIHKDDAKKRPGLIYYRYAAKAEDCQSCVRKPECCPENKKRGRSVARPEESPLVVAFRRKMDCEEGQAQYRRRGRVVEFCHAWIKSKLGVRQFHVRGLVKVQMEMLWACLTYNLQQWIRLRKSVIAAS
jgi:hypothetical protein